MNCTVFRLLAASALACSTPLALASADSAGGFGAVTFTLVDLDPNDGIMPSILFAPAPDGFAGPTVKGELRSYTSDVEGYREFSRIGLTPHDTVSAVGTTTMAAANGSVTGHAGPGFAAMTAFGTAGSMPDARGSYYLTASTPWSLFTLSANTAVQFSVDGWASAATSTGGDPTTGFDEAAGTLLYLGALGFSATGEPVRNEDQHGANASYTVDPDGHVHGTRDAWSGTLTVSFHNTTATTTEGRFGAELSTFGHSAVSPVPEPATGLMLLAGLGLIGTLMRRRA